ncbi:signal transduction histidine kinase [Barrientosiimonas humi]|uniref:histidine kinase n=1 Tax=Barrientosiimonas humi TaxID=999931 RepID=A0A542XCZ9_9MICO|nr:sensor histidine kinase [Barrientosiimonas humi]TQL33687.1 signal transduction histidine kinase [Barrientosiimonas humi]CAG7573674.1 Sensor histidine kinase DesK [Barrientosiimonas humi]
MRTEPLLEQPTRPTWGDWLLVGLLWTFAGLPYLVGAQPAVLAVVATVQIVPLAWRRAHPVVVFGTVALATLSQVPFSDNVIAANIALLFALYSLAAWASSNLELVLGLSVCAVGALVAGADWAEFAAVEPGAGFPWRLFVITAVMCLAVTVAAAALGDAARRRRQLVLQLRARAEDAERERDQHAQLAAQSERTRIAREMHDVVAHALAVIVVQSDGAAYAVRHTGSVGTAADALETIGATSREALAETRRLVGVLREEGSAAELAPSAGAGDIATLVDRVRDAGLPVQLETDGALEGLPREVGAAAYRVVQEALTNVIKHGGPDATASVTITRADDRLEVTVSDTGRGLLPGADDQHGHGLVGMRERTSVLGGSLRTGPRPGGGFVVTAEIPSGERTSAT